MALNTLFALLLTTTLSYAQSPDIRNERWGMTQAEVIKAENAQPVKRNDHMLLYRDKRLEIPAQVIFEFTGGKLDAVAYVAETEKPEEAFLKWCLELTRQYGRGEIFLDKKPVGSPGVALNESLRKFRAEKDGEIVVVYPSTERTTIGVGIRMVNGQPSVEADYAPSPTR